MFELIVRVLFASGAMAASGYFGAPNFDLTWRASLFFAAYSYLLYVMEQKGVRNSGVSGLAAVADCGILAAFIADAGAISQVGFVCAAPMLIAYLRHKANAAMMAPLVASLLLVGANLFGGGNALTPTLLLQSLGILAVGLVLSIVRTRIDERPEREAEARRLEETLNLLNEHLQPVEERPVETQTQNAVDADEYIEIRENFRALTDTARDLERKSRKDRACIHIIEAVLGAKDPISALTEAVLETSGCEGVFLHAVPPLENALVARAWAGKVDQGIADATIETGKRKSESEIVESVEKTIDTLSDPNSKTKFVCIALNVKGRLVGVLSLFHSSAIELEASARRAEETSDFVAQLVTDQIQRGDDRRKMSEAELLYTIAATSSGAKSASAIVGRVCRDLFAAVRLDHLSFWFIEDGRPRQQCLEGVATDILNEITFNQVKGFSGWLAAGTPVTMITNAREDQMLSPHAAIKRRIGSLLIVPLEFGSEPFGFVIATTSRVGGIDNSTVETIRAVCAETSLALARAKGDAQGHEGLATPKEFFEIVNGAKDGHLVYLEVPQREQLAEVYGKPALEHAVRRFAVRLRAELPGGGAITRRNEGDYVAFIPSSDIRYVTSWANDATALASMTGVTAPDGRTRIPLALRAKTAPVNPQNHRISTGRAA